MHRYSGRSRATIALAFMSAALLLPHAFGERCHAQDGFLERSLKSTPAPEPSNLNEFIADRDAAIASGACGRR